MAKKTKDGDKKLNWSKLSAQAKAKGTNVISYEDIKMEKLMNAGVEGGKKGGSLSKPKKNTQTVKTLKKTTKPMKRLMMEKTTVAKPDTAKPSTPRLAMKVTRSVKTVTKPK
jgi:hypothetical protein